LNYEWYSGFFWLIVCPLGAIWLLVRSFKENRESGSSVVKASVQTAKDGITGLGLLIGGTIVALVIIGLMNWMHV
jgi:hypothetical protein